MGAWSRRGEIVGSIGLVGLALVAPFAAGCVGNAPASGIAAGTGTAPTPAASDPLRIAELVNFYRASSGLRPLEYHPAVAAIAQAHADAMAAGRTPYSHAGLEDRVAAIGRRIINQAVGENLASVPPNWRTRLEGAVEGWILSDPHRQGMEGCYDLTGVGVARAPTGMTYISQIYVLRAPAQPSEARRGQDLERAGCR
jgi:uncharacterized protein YkwD